MSTTMIEALDTLIKRFEADGHRLMVHYDDDDLDRLWVQCRECGRVFCHEDIVSDLAPCQVKN